MLLSSCVVSKKKFEIAEAGRLAALYSRDSLAELLGISRYDCAMYDERVNALMTDTALLKGNIRGLQALLTSGQNENQKLNANLKDREQTIAELQKMIAQQNQKVKDLLSSVKDALPPDAPKRLRQNLEVYRLTLGLMAGDTAEAMDWLELSAPDEQQNFIILV